MEREDVRKRYIAKSQAEIASLSERGLQMSGNAFSSLLILKGELGPGDQGGRTLLAGPDGKALAAAFARLGYAPEDWCALSTKTAAGEDVDPDRLREALAVLDPATLVISDESASSCVKEAYAEELSHVEDFASAMLEPGHIAEVCGMRVMDLGGFEAALSDPKKKQIVWAYLKKIPPLGEPY